MRRYLQQLIDRLGLEEDGQGLAEYGLILALVTILCVSALTTLGTSINDLVYGPVNAIFGAL